MTSICAIFSLTFLTSLWGNVMRSFIFALSIAIADFSRRMASSACCFVLLWALTEKCASLSALSTTPTVYGLFVSGLTHLSATIVAMSLNIVSSWLWRSFSDTCSSPLAKIYSNRKVNTFPYYNFHEVGVFLLLVSRPLFLCRCQRFS